jgi:hypothetical protein
VIIGVKKDKQIEPVFKITNQTVYIDGCKISLSFLNEANEEIGSTIRSILLNNSTETNKNTLDSYNEI